MTPIKFTLKGDAKRAAVIKSQKARGYERAALMHIWYASERPDLDESIVLDVLQDRYEAHG
jgi:hypothetical protein